MMKPKPAGAPRGAKRTRFSLVPSEAQQAMYHALCALQSANGSGAQESSGAEIAEIAVCLAAGKSCPLVLACSAPGARIVSPQPANCGLPPQQTDSGFAGDPGLVGDHFADVSGEIGGKGRRLTSATLAAMDALFTRSLNGSPGEDSTDDVAGSKAAPGKNPRGKRARSKQTQHPREDAAIVCAGVLDAGAEAERDYRAAFRFAARHKLPILYVVANRLLPGQGAPLDLRAIYPEFGIPLFTVDANDAIAAYRVATEALHNARHLRGPSVIEALTLPHSSAPANHPLDLLTAYMKRHRNPPQETQFSR